MPDTPTDVLVAAYQDIDTATRDFDTLMERVRAKQVEIEGAILITHAAEGEVSVVQHGDHLSRKGLGWGAGAGLVVGLLAPPLLGSVVVGAAAGGLTGKFTDRKVEAGMASIGEQLPAGSAGVITVFDDQYRLAVEQALSSSPAKRSPRPTSRASGRSRRTRHRDGQVPARPDGAADPGPHLWRHDGTHARPVGRGLGHDPGAEGARGCAECAHRPDR
jgi:uncharacterized membrane protein